MVQHQKDDDYVSYLLRLYRSGRDEPATWRASLESTVDGQRIEFNSLEALIDFLRVRIGAEKNNSAGKEAQRQG